MKKVLSLVLAVVMVLGLTTSAFAAVATGSDAYDWATKSSNKAFKLFTAAGETSYKVDGTQKIALGTDEIKVEFAALTGKVALYLYDATDLKKDKGSDNIADYTQLTKAAANYYDVEVKFVNGSSVFSGVSINNDGTIKFEYHTYLDSTGSKAFDDKICVFADGKKMSTTEFTVKGKVENDKQVIDEEDETEIDLADGVARKLEVKANVRNAELLLDNNLTLLTTLYNGRNVYARSSNIPSNLQMAVLDKYNFDDVINLYAIGFTGSSSVKFDHPENLYIYGVDSSASYDAVADSVKLVYLGRSNQKLPLTTEYYLSTKEITLDVVADDEPPVEDNAPVDEGNDNVNTGGLSGNANINYNPGTGC